ncbi:MAG: twin-arginine translocase TatA/TatE family subunit [Nitrospina sp.]|nr:twin-arginine translocase TatA/TatE family subunit [Nitrospina sp.]
MMGIGFPELMVILVIIMIIFGAGKLPEIGSAFGRSIKNFKSSMKEAEELETPPSETAEASEGAETAETAEGAEASETKAGVTAKKPATKTAAAKKEEELVDEAALEIKENRIGTIRTKHDGLVQQNDVFTTSLGRTPGGRGRDRGVSRDTF